MDAGKFSLVALFFVIVMVGVVYGQAPDTLWTRTYPMFGAEFFGWVHFSVWQTTDGGFVVAGCSLSVISGSDLDIFLMKVDSLGEYLWGNHYAHGASAEIVLHEPRFVQQTTDGGFIIFGRRCVTPTPYSDHLHYSFTVKTYSSGARQWQRTSGAGQVAYCGEQTSDGRYIYAGCRNPYSINSNLLMSKRNYQGFPLWTQTYGGSNTDEAYSVRETNDGGYILAGQTASFGAGNYDAYIVKTNSVGNMLWSRTYGGSAPDNAKCVYQTQDGGYVFCGGTGSFGAGGGDVYLVRTDAIGDTLWTRTFGGSANDGAISMQITDDGGYILAGHTQSFGAGGYDFYVVKTDSLGDMEWSSTYGSSSGNYAYSVRQTHDGGYIVAGSTNGDDLYLVRIAAEETGIPQGNQDEILPEFYSLYSPFPNPFNAVVTVNYDVGGNGKVNVDVFNLLGEKVGTVAEHDASPGRYSVHWDAGDLPSGIYFVRMEAGEFQQTRKVVLLK